DIDRDYIVRGDQAVSYGLIDHIIDRRQLPAAPPAPKDHEPAAA
ncbi:MAG: hypothetical protein RJA49_1020, partial [Actinomycetota bacterium]